MAESLALTIQVTGYKKAAEALARMANSSFIRGMISRYNIELLQGAVMYAAKVTHVETGWLSRSHMYEYNSHTMRGRLFIDPRVAYVNQPSLLTRTRATTIRRPVLYGVYEHGRGGTHAFYERTWREYVLPRALSGMVTMTKEIDVLWK